MERFRDFLEARKALLAAELNARMEELLHGDVGWLAGPAAAMPVAAAVTGGLTSQAEEAELGALNDWVESEGYRAAWWPMTLPTRRRGNRKQCSI